MTLLTSMVLAVLLYLPSISTAQEPTSPPPPAGPTAQPAPDAGSSSSKAKKKEIASFLIIGTVFNEKALSFPGVQVRIRRSGEKKFLYETYTNSRGEFAVRVLPGYAYEVVTHVKKYEDQTRGVDSKVDVQQRLSIKLEPRGQKS
ncbi:MAG TPA: carboxypeptidase-like regulatory domain-containing protein [Verrucomicrobiae bacterium]|nr:carboxypeptidase-like regulatory domain-containing protein [Verrucomicrobiae bacterium]